MSNPRKVLIGVAIGVMALGMAAIIALALYSGSNSARASLLVQYFRALSTNDEAALLELTSPEFMSELGLGPLERGTYELYDFGAEIEGTVRFLLVATDAGGEKRAMLADMEFSRFGLNNRIDAIRRIDEGKKLKE